MLTRKHVKIGAAAFVALIIAVMGYATTQPDSFRIERTVMINAGPNAVLEHLNDFRRWQAWSPWEAMDPTMKRSYGPVENGPGAKYAWEGNSRVGRGNMEIVASSNERVTIMIDFYRPWEAHNIAEFTMVPQINNQLKVTWAMFGPNPYISKLVTVFITMDSMIGPDFEAGLNNLKALSEKK